MPMATSERENPDGQVFSFVEIRSAHSSNRGSASVPQESESISDLLKKGWSCAVQVPDPILGPLRSAECVRLNITTTK